MSAAKHTPGPEVIEGRTTLAALNLTPKNISWLYEIAIECADKCPVGSEPQRTWDAIVSRLRALRDHSAASRERERTIAQANAQQIVAEPELADELEKAEALIESARVLAIANGNAGSERAFTDGLTSIRAALRKAGRLP